MERCLHPAILDILLKDEVLASDVDLDTIAERTEGYSGSDLKRELYWIWRNLAVY